MEAGPHTLLVKVMRTQVSIPAANIEANVRAKATVRAPILPFTLLVDAGACTSAEISCLD